MKRYISFLMALLLLLGAFGGCQEKPVEGSESETIGEIEATETEAFLDPAALIGKIEGASSGFYKCAEDRESGSVTVLQKGACDESPIFTFYREGTPLVGSFWAVSGTIRISSAPDETGCVDFICYADDDHYAAASVFHKQEELSGIGRYIVTDGLRKPASSTEYVSANLACKADIIAEFAMLYLQGRFMLYMKEEGEEFELMTQYGTEFGACEARMEVPQYADVTISNIKTINDKASVKALANELSQKNQEANKDLRVLFIGNSATFTHDLPAMLEALAKKAGYNITAESYAKSGYELSRYLEEGNVNKKTLLNKIATGYDIVFLQENGDCAFSEDKSKLSQEAHQAFDEAIRQAGGKTYLYVRPPSGKNKGGHESFSQCVEYDSFFGEISQTIGAENAYVNRAFAYAIKNTSYNLWGPDNAHVSEYGAYLAVCVFFATLYDTSSSILESNDIIPDADAIVLQEIADKIVLEGYIPW